MAVGRSIKGPTSDNVLPLMGRSPLLQISSSVAPKLHWSEALPMDVPLSTHSGAIHGIRSRRSAVQNSNNKNDRSFMYHFKVISVSGDSGLTL